MPFYWTENGVTTQGEISVIPEPYRSEAWIHMQEVMINRLMGKNVPMVAVDISKSFYYKLDDQLVPVYDYITNNFPIK